MNHLLVLSDGMIMIRNGAQVYIMMLSSNRQPGGVLGVNPSRPAAPEALANNYHMSSGTPAERRRLVGEASAIPWCPAFLLLWILKVIHAYYY
jgi:hypothetical protein